MKTLVSTTSKLHSEHHLSIVLLVLASGDLHSFVALQLAPCLGAYPMQFFASQHNYVKLDHCFTMLSITSIVHHNHLQLLTYYLSLPIIVFTGQGHPT